MNIWYEYGRPAIFKALEAVCDDIDRELGTGG
jgi:hypothetical protein